MPLAEWPHHYALQHLPYHTPRLAKPVWFWWELAGRWPIYCMHCGVHVEPDGTCPNLNALPEADRYRETDYWGHIDPGCQWVPLPF